MTYKLPEPAGKFTFDGFERGSCGLALGSKLYTEAQVLQAYRDGLEAAAKVCEVRTGYWQRDDNRRDEDEACASYIRALKEQQA